MVVAVPSVQAANSRQRPCESEIPRPCIPMNGPRSLDVTNTKTQSGTHSFFCCHYLRNKPPGSSVISRIPYTSAMIKTGTTRTLREDQPSAHRVPDSPVPLGRAGRASSHVARRRLQFSSSMDSARSTRWIPPSYHPTPRKSQGGIVSKRPSGAPLVSSHSAG